MHSESAERRFNPYLGQRSLNARQITFFASLACLFVFVSVLLLPVFGFCAEDATLPYTANVKNAPMTFERVQRCPIYGAGEIPLDRSQINKCIPVPSELGNGPIILAKGTIALHSSDTLSQIVADWPAGSIVAFQSLGGDLMGGLRLGQYIRARSFYTYIPNGVEIKDPSPQALDLTSAFGKELGKCFSACAYSFLGGVARRVQDQALYGVHQFRAQESGLDSVQTQKISAILAKYMDAMNVSRLLLDQAMMTDPGRVSIVNESLRRSWRVEVALDYTLQQALPKWRLEITGSGNRLAFSSKKQTNSNAVVTIAIAKLSGQMRLLLIVKPDPSQEISSGWLDNFSSAVSLQIQNGSKLYVLQPISGWGKAGTVNTAATRQIWYSVNDELLQELKGTREFTIKPLWGEIPKGLDLEILFGTEGLSENLSSL